MNLPPVIYKIKKFWTRAHKTKTNKTKTQHKMCWTSLHAHKRKQRKSDMNPLKSIGGQGEPNIVYTWKSKDFTPRNSERRQI